MLPRSSERVARVIKLANRVAREYEQEYVGTEHVLLAIIQEGTGVGASLLVDRGVTIERLREVVDQLVRKQLEETWVFGRLPGTPHFKNVVAGAIKACQSDGAETLCTEHLLLALTCERGCVAQKALEELGVTHSILMKDLAAKRAQDRG